MDPTAVPPVFARIEAAVARIEAMVGAMDGHIAGLFAPREAPLLETPPIEPPQPPSMPAMPAAVVVDAGLARSTPCTRVHLAGGAPPLVFSPGIVGTLDEDQAAYFCSEGYEEQQATPEQQARLERMVQATAVCSERTRDKAGTPEHMDAYLACISEELDSGEVSG